LFIDEIDALAPKRDTVEGEVEKRITAQLLALMDGMEDRGAVMVLAATNLPNALDPALRRPGRFDREVFIGPPDRVGRREILEIHTRDMPLENVDLAELAERTHGFVGADIKALCQEAGFKALRRVLPGLEDTEQRLSEDFLDAVSICGEDFAEAVKEMRPSAGRGFESDVSRAGWNRIAGYEKAVEFLKDTVLWPMRNADALTGLGVGAITGMLITGPSGVGKTLFAETIAKESAANVIVIRGPELISKYMGESERNIRDLFRRARELAPTVLLLDGVDSMTDTGWSDSKVIDRIVDQIVMEMNALDDSKPVFVVATASRADRLPPALRASGKLGRELKLDIPAVEDRVGLLKMYLGKPSVRLDADLEEIAKMCDGFTPGDIEEAARRTLLHCAKKAIERLGSAPDHLNIGFEEIASAMDYGKFGFPAAR
jgi:transitional endoplasmic reticulum ATPase